MKKVLVLGAAGFVGEHMLEHLGSTRAYDIEVSDLDLLDADAVAALLRKVRPDRILHLASESSVVRSWTDPAQAFDENVKGAIHLLEGVRALPYPPRLLLVGSGEEYGRVGPEEGPVGEDHAVRPTNPYAATKAYQNAMGRIYAEAYRMDVLMTRTFNYFGPGQTTVFAVSDLCRQVVEVEKGLRAPVLRVGNLDVRRDFTDVRDVVRAYGSLMETGRSGETYNVGGGHAVAMKEILDLILAHSTAQVRFEVDQKRLRPVDMPLIEADIRKIVATTGWKPRIPLEQTVRDMLEDWRRRSG